MSSSVELATEIGQGLSDFDNEWRHDDAGRSAHRAFQLVPRLQTLMPTWESWPCCRRSSRRRGGFSSGTPLNPNHTLARAELGEVRYRSKVGGSSGTACGLQNNNARLLYLLCDTYFRLARSPVPI